MGTGGVSWGAAKFVSARLGIEMELLTLACWETKRSVDRPSGLSHLKPQIALSKMAGIGSGRSHYSAACCDECAFQSDVLAIFMSTPLDEMWLRQAVPRASSLHVIRRSLANQAEKFKGKADKSAVSFYHVA